MGKLRSMAEKRGFPGLHNMAEMIADYFPLSYDVYVEPFCGHARTRPRALKRAQIVLNDLNPLATDFCKKHYGCANTTFSNEDFADCMKRYIDNPRAFLLIDPPWVHFPCYARNNSVNGYYAQIFSLLAHAKCSWILCGSKPGPPCSNGNLSAKIMESNPLGMPTVVLKNEERKIYGRCCGITLLISPKSLIF